MTTSLLLHMNGTNGATTFPDTSGNSITVTPHGAAQVSTTSPKLGSGSLSQASATADYLTTAASAAFAFGTGDFTVDFWFKSSRTLRMDPLGADYDFDVAGWWGMILNLGGSGTIDWFEGVGSVISVTSTGVNDGNWHHIAVTRSGNSVRLFVDGVQKGSTYTTSYTYGDAGSGVIVGQIHKTPADGDGVIGNIDELRILKGEAAWTAGFTPPTSEYADASTDTLMPQICM